MVTKAQTGPINDDQSEVRGNLKLDDMTNSEDKTDGQQNQMRDQGLSPMSRALPLMNIQGDESSVQTQVVSQVIPQPPTSKGANHGMLHQDNQDSREAILLNVDSTVLKLDNSNVSNESM